MSRRYAVAGPVSGELLSLGGRILVHPDRAELEFLLADQRVVEVPAHVPPEQTMPWSQHPQMAAVNFPLERSDFR
jgi:hypothetical protein